MNKVFKISLISALAGFLFGFDTVVISGADQQLQSLWNTSDLFHGTFVMSMALWGTVLGAIFASYPCNYFGKKITTFVGLLGSFSWNGGNRDGFVWNRNWSHFGWYTYQ